MAQYVPEDSTSKEKGETEKKSGFDVSRLVPGGNMALGFGNPYFFDFSPSLGYLFTDDLLAGAGLTYLSWGYSLGGSKFTRSYYGARILARYQVKEPLFANVELEGLNAPYDPTGYGEEQRVWTFNPMVGASYVVPFGRRGGIQATLLYNLNYKEAYSPYSSALVWRIGFFL
jgi:hypothetical protein